MLYIAASYHYMQFQGKLMNQTWKMAKTLLAQIWAPKIFIVDFTSARC